MRLTNPILYLVWAGCAKPSSCIGTKSSLCDATERSDISEFLQVERNTIGSLPAPSNSHASKSLPDLIADAVEDLTNFLNSHTSLSDMRLEALQHVGSASAFRSQMVGLSFWTYGIHTFIDGWAGWSLAKSFIDTRPKNGAPGYDVAAIFVKEDQCAMVFSGTSGLADITTDFTFNVFHPCDYLPCGLHGVHEGFFNDVQQFMLNGSYAREFEPFLHRNCTGGVTLAGHSQGAAMSEIFASCVNAGDSVWIPELKRDGKVVNEGALLKTRFQVNNIFTTGSPGTARVGIKNPLETSGIFQGERIFTQDWIYIDPVPASTSELDFWHPKMPAMRLFKTNDTAVRAENIAASQAWEPPLLIPTAHSLAVLDIKRHLQYVEWLLALGE